MINDFPQQIEINGTMFNVRKMSAKIEAQQIPVLSYNPDASDMSIAMLRRNLVIDLELATDFDSMQVGARQPDKPKKARDFAAEIKRHLEL